MIPHPSPSANGGFDGFVAAQARQLFEMTKR